MKKSLIEDIQSLAIYHILLIKSGQSKQNKYIISCVTK